MSIGTVGVIGAGQMGAGVAQVAAQAGVKVLLNDISEDFVARGLDSIALVFELELKHAVDGNIVFDQNLKWLLRCFHASDGSAESQPEPVRGSQTIPKRRCRRRSQARVRSKVG